MPNHRFFRLATGRLAAAAALAAVVAMPATAQDKKDDGDGLKKEITRIAQERASRIRDLLTMIAIGALPRSPLAWLRPRPMARSSAFSMS